ncbi:MAG: ParA family partition ATPase [Alphaproteobacteria bacterium]
MIISFLNQKGGVGKTTLAINVAGYLASKGLKILVIDADEQRSSLNWARMREIDPIFTTVGMPEPILHKDGVTLAKEYDHVIIDGPPRVYAVARSAIVASDLVVIPVQPSPYDVWAAEEIINLIKEVAVPLSEIKKIKPAFLINRKIHGTAIGRDVQDALAQYSIPCLKTAIHQRVVYADTAAEGKTVLEQDTNKQAKEEMMSLGEEILNFER